MSLSLNTRHVNDVTVVDVAGRITLGDGTNTLRDAMEGLVAGGGRKVLLNLADTSYIDSSGFGELVSGYTSLRRAGGSLKLLNPTQRIKSLLDMTNLSAIFEVHDDEARAVQSFG
jgi:anti-sigma B factor antagonist